MKVEYRSIGVIRTPFANVEGMPIQPSRARDVEGIIEVFPEFQEGLSDLEGFSHLILLYHFHRVRGYSLRVIPFLDKEPRGIFATRAPKRPNPIGLSVVRLRGMEGNRLWVLDVDILDGTPLLDIKPYVPEFDSRSRVRIGWLEEAKRERKILSDDRFA